MGDTLDDDQMTKELVVSREAKLQHTSNGTLLLSIPRIFRHIGLEWEAGDIIEEEYDIKTGVIILRRRPNTDNLNT